MLKGLCQLELFSENPSESADFLLRVLGWTRLPFEIMDLILLTVPDNNTFGISLKSQIFNAASIAVNAIPYFKVQANLTSIEKTILENGGKISSTDSSSNKEGVICVIEDPFHLKIGLLVIDLEKN